MHSILANLQVIIPINLVDDYFCFGYYLEHKFYLGEKGYIILTIDGVIAVFMFGEEEE
jgi:hypothetical protein